MIKNMLYVAPYASFRTLRIIVMIEYAKGKIPAEYSVIPSFSYTPL